MMPPRFRSLITASVILLVTAALSPSAIAQNSDVQISCSGCSGVTPGNGASFFAQIYGSDTLLSMWWTHPGPGGETVSTTGVMGIIVTFSVTGDSWVSFTARFRESGSSHEYERSSAISVHVWGPPTITRFDFYPASPKAGQSTAATIHSTETTTFVLDFGDGSSATGDAAAFGHTYAHSGSYLAQLTVSGPGGAASQTTAMPVQPPDPPIAQFDYSPGPNPNAGDTVEFRDLSLGWGRSWLWDFGDGSSASTLASPAHTFPASHNYKVRQTVTNESGTSTFTTTLFPLPLPGGTAADAAFGFLPPSPSAGEVTELNDASTGSPTFLEWDFGDGSPRLHASSTQHTFGSAGTFSVSLDAANAYGGSTMIRPITVRPANSPPLASWSVLPMPLVAGQPAQFKDLSSGFVTSWFWNFGDGSTSTERHPAHTYAAAGSMPVSLTVTNAFGFDSRSESIPVVAGSSAAPTANFNWSPDSPAPNELVTFTDTSSGSPASWSWLFGDGGSSTSRNTTHTYAAAGQYIVNLSVSNANGTNMKARQLTVAPRGPIANFSWTPGTPAPGAAVSFTDQSTGSPLSWTWTFGDGSTAGQQNPTHTYAVAGTYTVTLSIANPTGSDSLSKTLAVSEGELPPQADFTFLPTIGTVGQAVRFTDTSTGKPASWLWEFGDQATSTLQNPSHVFAFAAGAFNVRLTVTNSKGTDSRVRPVEVRESTGAPIASFIVTPEHPIAGSPATLQDTSQNAPTSWSWTFGDGSTGTGSTVAHTWTNPGTWTVNLTATNEFGTASASQSVLVVDSGTLAANFQVDPAYPFAGQPAQFTDLSSGNPDGRLWTFGDDTGSLEVSPRHTFIVPGSYVVTLNVQKNGAQGTPATRFVVVRPGVPRADFTTSTVLPQVGQEVTFSDTSSNLPTRWSWSVDGVAAGSARTLFTTFSATGMHIVQLSVANDAGQDSIARQLEVIPVPATQRPNITQLTGKYGPCFFQGVSIPNDYSVGVAWRDFQPGSILDSLNGAPAASAPATAAGGSFTVDTGLLKTGPLFTDNTLTVTAGSMTGEASDPETLHLLSMELPPWYLKGNLLRNAAEPRRYTIVRGRLFPNPEFEATIDVPKEIPVFGGRPVGLTKTQFSLENTLRTDCTSSVAVKGEAGLTAAGVTLAINAHGGAGSSVSRDKGVVLNDGSVGLEGTLTFAPSPMPIAELIPALAVPCRTRLLSPICSIAVVKAEGGAALSLDQNFTFDASGNPVFKNSTSAWKFFLTAGMSVAIGKKLEAQVYGGGNFLFTVGTIGEPPFFKKVAGGVEVGAKFRELMFQQEFKRAFACSYTPETSFSCGQDAEMGLLYDFDRALPLDPILPFAADHPREIAVSHRRARGESIALQDLSPLATPVATAAGSRALVVFVRENPNASNAMQRTDMASSIRDGDTWSQPVPITADTLGEFNPSVAGRADGSAVAAWERIRNSSLTFDDIKVADDLPKLHRELEIVASVWNPANATWSSPVALSDNDQWDHGAVLASLTDGRIVATWIRDDPSATAAPKTTSVVSRVFDGSGWGAEQLVIQGLDGVDDIDVASSGTELALVYSHDKAGDPTAAADREVAVVFFRGGKWTAPADLTADSIADLAPHAVYATDGARVVWLHGPDLVWQKTGGAIETIRAGSSPSGLLAARLARTAAGRVAVIWADPIGESTDVVARVWDPASSTWSEDIPLTSTPDVESNLSAWFGSDDVLHVVGLQTAVSFRTVQTAIGAVDHVATPGQVDLVALDKTLHADLGVVPGSISVTPAGAVAGQKVTLHLTAVNEGDLPVRDVPVTLVEGAGPAGTALSSASVAGTWRAGETKTIDLDFNYDPGVSIVTAAVDPSGSTGDANLADNLAVWSFTHQPPMACIQASAVAGAPPLAVSLNGACSAATDGSILSYRWSWADGGVATGSTSSRTLSIAGDYRVVLTVTDSQGATAGTSLPIHVGTVADTRATSSKPRLYLPVSGRTAGVAGSFFVTDVALFNPDQTSDLDVDAIYSPDGKSGIYSAHLFVPPATVRPLPDIFARTFSAADGAGWVRFDLSRSNAIAVARIYNQQPSGTAGLSMRGLRDADALVPRGRRIFLQHWLPGYRTNVGFTEIMGLPGTVTVAAFDESGNSLGTKSYGIGPFQHQQVTGEPLFQSRGRLEMTVTGTSILPSTSTTDNSTGDPIYQEGEAPPAAGAVTLLAPSVARLAGANNTTWRSDLRVHNPNASAVQTTLTLTTAAASYVKTATLSAGQTANYDDVITTQFPEVQGDAAGSLVIEAPQSVIATARTYNLTDQGTYGLYSPVRRAAQLLTAGDTGEIIGLENDADYRCNFGMTALTGDATVLVRAFDAGGALLGQKTYGVAARQNQPVNRIFEVLGVTDSLPAARLEVLVLSGGPVYAYAAVVDNRTGDSTFVEATK